MNPTVQHKELIKTKIKSIYDIGHDCWDDLAQLISFHQIDKNEHYSNEGQFIKELGFITDGILRIYYLNDKGEEWTKHFLASNDFIAASIDPEKESITNIQALTPVEMLSIPYSQLKKLSDIYRQIDIFIQKLTNQYLATKQEREIILLSEDSTQRYLSFKKKHPDFENRIQHYHIASYLGITPTQLSRIKKHLKF